MDPTAIAEQATYHKRGSYRLIAFLDAYLNPGTYGKSYDWFQMTPSIGQTLTTVIAFTDIARRQEILPRIFYRKIDNNNLKKSLLSTEVSVTAST
jgi:hypothetical protein